MTDKKFTDDEIVKALECCGGQGCKECPFNCNCATCIMTLQDSALSLINRQKAELEDLREIVFMDRSEAIKNLKSEAIKEFAKKIKTDAERICDDNYIEDALIKYVDTLVKEMTETK